METIHEEVYKIKYETLAQWKRAENIVRKRIYLYFDRSYNKVELGWEGYAMLGFNTRTPNAGGHTCICLWINALRRIKSNYITAENSEDMFFLIESLEKVKRIIRLRNNLILELEYNYCFQSRLQKKCTRYLDTLGIEY